MSELWADKGERDDISRGKKLAGIKQRKLQVYETCVVSL